MTNSLSFIEEEFLAWGFKYSPLLNSYPVVPAFEKVISTSIGNFSIQFPIYDKSLVKPPVPRLISIPSELEKVRLPHLEGNRNLCLFDHTTRNIDPLSPRALIAACIEQSQKIIKGWVDGTTREEIANEFSSYWEPDRYCYLLSDKDSCKLYSFDRAKLNGKNVTELVIANDIKQANDWAQRRSSLDDEPFKLPAELCSTITIKSRHPFFIPFEQSWPLSTLGELLHWLSLVDKQATVSLIDKLRNEAKTSSKFMIVIRNETTYIGLKLTLTPLGKSALFVSTPKKSKINHKHIISALSKKHCLSVFERVSIENTTLGHIFTRNNTSFKGLSNKRICLIGCGTIGGYLAQSIVQSGAGTGKGELHLYDQDTLKPGNLGRHILGISYLGEVKSDALAHYFLQQGLATNVIAKQCFYENEIDKGWDLIIDTTGEQSFSLLLASWYNSLPSEKKRALVHSWVSGFGHQAKALITRKNSPCYGCLFDYNQKQRTDRYKSYNNFDAIKMNSTFKRTCGESHLPFGPEASMSAAALAMRLIKQEETKRLNFLQKALSDKPIKYSEKPITPMRNCPICQS